MTLPTPFDCRGPAHGATPTSWRNTGGAQLLYEGIKPMLLKQAVELGIKRMARGFGQGMGRHPDLLLLTFPAFAHRHHRPSRGSGSFFGSFINLEKGRYDGQSSEAMIFFGKCDFSNSLLRAFFRRSILHFPYSSSDALMRAQELGCTAEPSKSSSGPSNSPSTNKLAPSSL